MEEKRTGGGKEFIFSLLWAVIFMILGQYIIFILPSYKIIGTIITILLFCILGFFVLTRYAAIFTYSIKDDIVRVNRAIGHRNKEVEFYISDVKSVTRQKPQKTPKTIYNMRASVFSPKKVWYVVYEKNRIENMLVFEPSQNMAEKIKSRAKNSKAKTFWKEWFYNMVNVIGVRFKPAGKTYYFDPLDFDIKQGDSVIVETSRGIEYGEVVMSKKTIDNDQFKKPLKGVIRIATEEDTEKSKRNRELEKEAYKICLEKIQNHKLEMKLVEVEYTFDGNKILFYFTADGRIDFRELVKDLAMVFKTRIELRQIGVRDEAKTLGSIGVCGRGLCCSQFLGEFAPVSIKMAKEQGLSLNPTKISGACGRLMCCLKYEQDTYEELLKVTPKQGTIVKTPEGTGSVEYVSLLKGLVKVKLDDENEKTLKEFNVADVKVLKKGKNNEPSEEEIGE